MATGDEREVRAALTGRAMRIVRPGGYLARFNTPRHSRHTITTRPWPRAHRIWKPLESVLFMPDHGADLLACVNQIPLGFKPFVISFESHLPRLFGYEKTLAFRVLSRILAGDRCRAIVPMSAWARNMFLRQHAGSEEEAAIRDKLMPVVHPAVPVPPEAPGNAAPGTELRVIFVGSHFGRKGGPALLLAAERAAKARLPIRFDIVSGLVFGRENGAWTDPPAADFECFRPLLELPNVHHHGRLPNSETVRLLADADVAVLATLSDTFGFSAIESLAAGTAVIGTSANALPEIVRHGATGHLLDLETDRNGEWVHLFSLPAADPRYRRVWLDTMHTLADQLFRVLATWVEDPEGVAQKKRAAHADARARFCAERQGRILDDLYEAALAGTVSRRASDLTLARSEP